MAEINILINSRKFMRKKVTESYNDTDNFITLTVSERLVLKNKLSEYSKKLEDFDYKIQCQKFVSETDDTLIQDDLEKCDEYQGKIISCLAVLESLQTNSNNVSNVSNPYSNPTLLKCPTAPLPKYSGHESEDISKFFFQFEKIINKYNFGEFEKLLLLKQQVSDRPLLLINTLETEKQGYKHAKELLMKALASSEVQKNKTIKLLSELKMENHEDPLEFFSRMKFNLENIDKLKITTSCIVKYFVWMYLIQIAIFSEVGSETP